MDKRDLKMLLAIKIGSMLILGFGSLLCGMIPAFIKTLRSTGHKNGDTGRTINQGGRNHHCVDHSHAPSQGRCTSFLICVGGGVILFTAFMHILPEIRESAKKNEMGFLHWPIVEFLMLVGFCMVYFIEDVVHEFLSHGNKDCIEDPIHGAVSLHCNEHEVPRCTVSHERAVSRISLNSANSCCHDIGTVCLSFDSGIPRDENSNVYLRETTINPSQTEVARNYSRSDPESASTNQVPEQPRKDPSKVNSPLRGLMTIVALSFHAIFEGLAVGLSQSENSALTMAGAIATHKFVIAFCIGVELMHADMRKRKIFYSMMVFSIVTPLGTLIGMFFDIQNSGDGPISVSLQALAAGTLIYVVFFEILARERASNNHKFLHLGGIMTGFLLMMGISLLLPHDHGHDDDAHHHDHHH